MAIVGLDHVILAVHDLSSASSELADRLGVVVQPGGEHPGWGTHNAIVRFGVPYLELIAVNDVAEARQRPRGERLLSALAHGDGWLGFALGVDDLDRTVADLRSRGLTVGDPEPGRRTRPDGVELRWRTAQLGSALWGSELPFLIQHETPPAVRASWAPADGHPGGAVGIAALDIGVPAASAEREAYGLLLENARLPDGCQIRLVASHAHTGLFSVTLTMRNIRAREATTVLGARFAFLP